MANDVALVWFRQDLRLADNPALTYACDHYQQVIPVYIYDPDAEGEWAPGAASRWWLHHSLKQLHSNLRQRHSTLVLRAGNSLAELQQLIKDTGATMVCWNRRYEPLVRERDSRIKKTLDEQGTQVHSFNASLWWEPWEISTQQGKPYRVFTPMWNSMLEHWRMPSHYPVPQPLPALSNPPATVNLEKLELLPTRDWDRAFYEHWTPGEQGAQDQLQAFTRQAMQDYQQQRDIPDEPGTSRLSPHLHSGDISTRQIVRQLCPDGEPPLENGVKAYIRELAWREFSWHLLYHFPQLPEQGLQEKFHDFPWRSDYAQDLIAWQRGQTGVPMVDAGMRELWKTGWMHNRVRMIVASYLTKNLLIPWQQGERWFWDTLVDADLGNNAQGWQWTAGCGADASPYFRIFNPVTQGERFDPDGDYVRRWIPELSAIQGKKIHSPWSIGKDVLAELGITLGETYPQPLVDLKGSRERALDAYQKIR